MPGYNHISIGNNRLFTLNSFNIQKVSRRGTRQNYNNELDDFIDDQLYFKAPESSRPQMKADADSNQHYQPQPNNNQINSTAKAPEPNNEVEMFKMNFLKRAKLPPPIQEQESKPRQIIPNEAFVPIKQNLGAVTEAEQLPRQPAPEKINTETQNE